jgi:hypothetical protein
VAGRDAAAIGQVTQRIMRQIYGDAHAANAN